MATSVRRPDDSFRLQIASDMSVRRTLTRSRLSTSRILMLGKLWEHEIRFLAEIKKYSRTLSEGTRAWSWS